LNASIVNAEMVEGDKKKGEFNDESEKSFAD